MSLKLTIFYNSGHTGWTETWYQPGTSSINSDVSSWDNIFKKGIAFRGKGCVIYGVRQTLFGSVIPLSYFVKFGNKYVRPITDPATQDPDVVSTDALYYIYSPDKARKRPVYLRGLVDDDVKVDANFVNQPTSTLTTAVNNYLKALKDSGFGMLLINKPSAPPNDAVPVTKVEADVVNPNMSKITLQTTMNLTLNAQVKFRGVKRNDIPGFPTIGINKSPDNPLATTFLIPYRFRCATTTYSPVKMTAQLYVTTPLTIDTWQFWNFSEHKAGRPFGQLRGRSRSVVRAQ